MFDKPQDRIRISATIFAVVLVLAAIWMAASEILRPDLPYFPANAAAIKAAVAQRDLARTAAFIGWPRGVLAVDAAMISSARTIEAIANGQAVKSVPTDLQLTDVKRAVALAPADSRAWLLLAAADIMTDTQTNRRLANLKMSYYTAPNDIRLIPFRLQLAVRSPDFSDAELRSLVESDLRTLSGKKQNEKDVIAIAFLGASPAGRRFLLTNLAAADPGLAARLDKIRP